MVMARALVTRQTTADPGIQLRGSHFRIGYHIRDRDLTHAVVRMPDHAGVIDGRMVENRRLDFDWGYLEPRHLDHVLEPVDDPKSAVGVDLGEIACAEPAVRMEGVCVVAP